MIFAMMSKSVVFLNLIVALFLGSLHAFHPHTENNYILVGHVFQTEFTDDWFSCLHICHHEPKCTSYNFKKSAEAQGLCELNDNGREDLCDRDKCLIYSPGFVFQQLKEVNKVTRFSCSLKIYSLIFGSFWYYSEEAY